MKIAKSYHIAGREIKVVVGTPAEHPCLRYRREAGKAYSGDSDLATGTITVNSEHSREEQVSTLFHEVFHMIDMIIGLELTEKQVKRLERAWYMFLFDNFEIRNKRRAKP